MDLNSIKEKLSGFGTVEQCEIIDNEFHLKITEGFNINALNTFRLMKQVSILTENQYETVLKAVSDNNLFHYILKKEIQQEVTMLSWVSSTNL